MVKIWHFSGKFDQHLSLYCGFVKPKTEIQDRAGISVIVRVLWVTIYKIYWQFWHSVFKYTFKSSSNFYPIDVTWRKMARSICLKPVSLETWRLQTLWRFTIPAYCWTSLPDCSKVTRPSTCDLQVSMWPVY